MGGFTISLGETQNAILSSDNALAETLKCHIFFAMEKYKQRPEKSTAQEQYSSLQKLSKKEKMKERGEGRKKGGKRR